MEEENVAFVSDTERERDRERQRETERDRERERVREMEKKKKKGERMRKYLCFFARSKMIAVSMTSQPFLMPASSPTTLPSDTEIQTRK